MLRFNPVLLRNYCGEKLLQERIVTSLSSKLKLTLPGYKINQWAAPVKRSNYFSQGAVLSSDFYDLRSCGGTL